MFQAFLFDLDGTLADTERENAASVEAALAARGRPLTDDERAYIVGHGWKDIYLLLEGNRPTGFTYDGLKTAASLAKIELLRKQGLTRCEGGTELVARLAKNGRLGVVTGSSRMEAEFVLEQMDLRKALASLVAAEDVSAGKPSPEGYLLAAEQLGLTPAHCLVFEDSAAGIEAARRAGMACIAISAFNFAGHDQTAAHQIVETLAEVTDEMMAAVFHQNESVRGNL